MKGITRRPFGSVAGQAVERFTIANAHALEVDILTYGAIVASINTPDRQRRSADVVLGCDTLEGYVRQTAYLGAVVGRYANRIARGRFALDGRSYQLAVNDGVNHLHGGPEGFHRRLWTAEPITVGGDDGVLLSRTSPDGEENYPGTLQVGVSYIVRRDNVVQIDYTARAETPTIVNLTQHTYFNLSGDPDRGILAHQLFIDADTFTPVDGTQIPTGALRSVAATPFDFRESTPVGRHLEEDDEQLGLGRGYDHNWVLTANREATAAAVRLLDPRSGRELSLATTEPGVQFYGGQLLDGRIVGKHGVPYRRYSGLCLEPQQYPDSPNQPGFPSPVIRPGRDYRTRTTWGFDVRTGT
jgi:aldose 1-epimerase